MDNGIRLRRLERLYHLLITDANKPDGVRFNMLTWLGLEMGGTDGPKCQYRGFRQEDRAKFNMSCGTHACVLGLACLDPEFRSEGLNFQLHSDNYYENKMVPFFGGQVEIDAGIAFFGLDPDEALRLFDPGYYDNAKGRDAELEAAGKVKGLIQYYAGAV